MCDVNTFQFGIRSQVRIQVGGGSRASGECAGASNRPASIYRAQQDGRVLLGLPEALFGSCPGIVDRGHGIIMADPGSSCF